jgi:hypothetical protein
MVSGLPGLDDERMDIGLHQLPDRRIDQPVPLERGAAPKRLGGNADTKMAEPARRTGVPDVVVALILDEELERRKTLPQDLLQARCALGAVQGSTGR